MWIADPKLTGNKYDSNIHHCYPQSRWGNDTDQNKAKLYVRFHEHFHSVFWNLTPQEQLLKLLLINKTIWTEEFKNDIYKILKESDEDYYYVNWIFLHK